MSRYTIEWLKKNALFLCDRCAERRDESQVRPCGDLKFLDGQLICEDCWTESPDDPEWSEIEDFNPFEGLVGE